MMKKIMIYDSTLRDGAQAQGISFTVQDKLKIAQKLDEFGVDYIEAGNPGSNPKDLEFFEKVRGIEFKNSKLTAFGSTRRKNISVEEDSNVKAMIKADTPAVAVFGKSWNFHVTDVIRTSLDENLKMIYDTISFFKKEGKEVIYDAEHFFDGYKANSEYSLKTLQAAFDAGADSLCLCDTNGGTNTIDIYNITKLVIEKFKVDVGIHCHNDTGMAVGSSVAAVQAGAVQVQGTLNGFGERCGNANICTIIPNLQLKLGLKCVPGESITRLTEISRFINEIANIVPNERAPYTGNCAFTHKGGMHIDAVRKNTASFEHINPEIVGNKRIILMSEVAGRSTILKKINEINPDLAKDSPETQAIIDKLKQLEHEGYQFEGAEQSFELVIRRQLKRYKPFFELKEFKVIVNQPALNEISSSALIKIKVGNEEEITAAEGDGPVNALDKAIRKALEKFYPQLAQMHLSDYKVRILDSSSATAAKTRVLIESTDGKETWGTIGVSKDIIEASWQALVDSIEYKLLKDNNE